MKNQSYFKKLFFVLGVLALAVSSKSSMAQVTGKGISFQAVARDAFSNPAKDRNIVVETSIIQSDVTGIVLLTERFNTTTDASLIDASANISYNNSSQSFAITSTATSTSTDTGALVVTGGVGVQGSIYSADGNPLQNNLLYTPKVIVTNTGTPPANPNVGDFWVDGAVLGYFQFIQDGTSTFWIQVTTL